MTLNGLIAFLGLLIAAYQRYCQLNSRRNKNRDSDKMNRRSSSGQLTIASTQIASSHAANLDFITAR